MNLSIENMLEALAALIVVILILLFPWVVLENIKHRRQRKADKREDYADYVERTRLQYVAPPVPVRVLHMTRILALLDEDEDDDAPVERSGRNDIRLTSEYINLYLNILDHAERLYKEK